MRDRTASDLYRRLPWSASLGRIRARLERRRAEDVERRWEATLYAFVASCAVQPWGGRDMLLFHGPLERVAAIGTFPLFAERMRRRGPQWWWPEDRQ